MSAETKGPDRGASPERDWEARLRALEERLDRLENHEDATVPAAGSPPSEAFWALTELRSRHPEGAVLFAGHTDGEDGPVEWQYGRPVDHLMSTDWAASAPVLDALGHPARMMLLQLIATGVETTAGLAQQEGLGTSGQVHHHLRILLNAGWLTQAGRGRYRIATTRLIPLLAILTAAERN